MQPNETIREATTWFSSGLAFQGAGPAVGVACKDAEIQCVRLYRLPLGQALEDFIILIN
jgi:hypothetical protein